MEANNCSWKAVSATISQLIKVLAGWYQALAATSHLLLLALSQLRLKAEVQVLLLLSKLLHRTV